MGLLLSCGKMGDPLPPVIQYPDTIDDLQVQVGKRGPRLLFNLPSTDIEHVEVYRLCAPVLIEERSVLIARLFQDELVEATGPNKFAFEDGDPAVRQGCKYAVRFVDSAGFQSKYSNFVSWKARSSP